MIVHLHTQEIFNGTFNPFNKILPIPNESNKSPLSQQQQQQQSFCYG